MRDQLYYISRIPLEFWEIFAGVVVIDPKKLGDDCLLVAMIGSSYIDYMALEKTREFPLLLTQGDIDHKLTELKRRPLPPGEDTADRIYHSLVVGEPTQEELVDNLVLIKQTHCSTINSERGHGAGAIMRNKHRDCCNETIRVRAHLSAAVVLARQPPVNPEIRLRTQQIAIF